MTDNKTIKIYTKTGDNGTTSLFNSKRVKKDSDYMKALGDVDETNACIGIVYTEIMNELDCKDKEIIKILTFLENIQSRLLDIGSHIATPLSNSSETKIKLTNFSKDYITEIEKEIDYYDDKLPQLKNFILPNGKLSKSSSQTHLARTVCRRAERNILILFEINDVCEEVFIYVNRLSDYLFTLSRYLAMKKNGSNFEVIYKKK